MIVLKVRQSWTHVGTVPLFRALILGGITYYIVLALAFGFNIVATMNSEVGGSTPLRLVRCTYSLYLALLSHCGHQVCRGALRSYYVLTTPTVSLYA
jgi:hypothetical protein